ncbi:MAG: ATP synthase F1 subunit delta [Planctomycetota bacterium]|nr:MAG: ATP synthase F1 subunit delta [Planctomycetota bacterium]
MATTKHIDEIASVYAKSLLEVCDAVPAGGITLAEGCAAELRDLSELIAADKQFAEFLKTPIIGQSTRLATLDTIIKGRVSDLVYRFLMVLASHGRTDRLTDVSDAFDSLLQDRLGRIEVDMITVDGHASADVIATVKARVKEVFSKDAVLHQYADPKMIGGVKLRIGDQLIDGSVATELRNMSEALTNRGAAAIRTRPTDFIRD